MQELLLQLLVLVISNPQLHEVASQPIADALANILPDVTEDHIAAFLTKVAEKLAAANP